MGAWLVVRLLTGLPTAKAIAKAVAGTLGFGIVSLAASAWWLLWLAGWIFNFWGSWRREHSDLELAWQPDENAFTLRSLDSEQTIALDQVEQATSFELDNDAAYSCLQIALRDGRDLELEMPTKDAAAFLQHTRLGPRHRAYRLRAHRVGFGAIGVLGYFMFAPAGLMGFIGSGLGLAAMDYWLQPAKENWSYKLLLALLIMFVLGAVWDSMRWLLAKVVGHQVDLGNDGIRWGSWFSPRFVPYSEITSIQFEGGHSRLTQDWLVLRTQSGEVFRVGLRGTGQGSAQAVRTRLRGVLGQQAELLVPEFEQGDRSDSAWRSELRELVRGDTGYRQRRMPREKVHELLHDPAAPADQRLGAAVALLETREPNLKEQLVRICQGTANPTLKRRFADLADEAEAMIEFHSEAEATEHAPSAVTRSP